MDTGHALIKIGASVIEMMAVALIVGTFLGHLSAFLYILAGTPVTPIRDTSFFSVERCLWGWSFLLLRT
jgi:hypothetical protein